MLFFQNVALQLIERLTARNEDAGSVDKFFVETKDQLYLVALGNWPLDDAKGAGVAVGLLFNPAAFKSPLLSSLIERNMGPQFHWQVKDRHGRLMLQCPHTPTGEPVFKALFSPILPWTLELYQNEASLVSFMRISNHSIYFYIFIFIAVILTFGLYLTVRLMTHELELVKLKSNFVSALSHDLKSPLTSIRHIAEMLQVGRVAQPRRRQQYYDVLVEQSERMSFLIDNILDSARIEAGRTDYFFEKVDVAKMLNEMLRKLERRLRQEGFAIETRFEKDVPHIVVDSVAVQLAIANLIDNAVKYSDKKKIISIALYTENKFLCIAVEDKGVGIPAKEIDKIFNRFYQGDGGRNHSKKGSGLGLALVKDIVNAHHGCVQATSEPGQGSVFTIKLPIRFKEKRTDG